MVKVSIIVPVYGVEAYIEECLASVAAQTCRGAVECILVDDCSPDASMDIARCFVAAYGGPIEFRLLRHACNSGQGVARHTGVVAARGEYVLFLDSDDMLAPHAIENLLQEVEAQPGVEAVFSELQTFGNAAEGRRGVSLKLRTSYEGRRACRSAFFSHRTMRGEMTNVLLLRDFVLAHSLTAPGGLLCEDVEWSFRAGLALTRFGVCREITYLYRIHGASTMQDPRKQLRRMADTLLIVLRSGRRVQSPGKARQVAWLLYYIVDFSPALRHAAGDCAPASDRLLRALLAAVRRLRRAAPWSSPLLLASLLMLEAELRSPLRLRSRLFMPVHRAAKMLYLLASRRE